MKTLHSSVTEAIVRPDGIIEVHTKSNWDQPDTPETARESALMLQKAIGDDHYALLSFPPNLYVKKEIINAYLEVPIGQVADAVVVKSFGARLLGSLALKLNKRPTPVKIFGNKKDAETWLLQQLEAAKAS